jgi:isoquinoline 1-oxidoreductase beta subunit
MEPPAAAAMMHEDGSVEIWAATQAPQSVQGTVANLLGIDKTQVKVHVTLLGGAFGRKSKADFSAEAAWLAKKTGKPVKVSWSREDDIRHGYYHSVSAQYLKGALDEEGNTTAWLHRSVFPSIGSTFSAEATGPGIFELELGMIDNPFAIPGFADELAHEAGADPRDYLLRLAGPSRKVNPVDDGVEYSNYGQSLDVHPIDTARYKAVVEKVSAMAGWGRALPDGHGLGIAVHRSFLSTVGTVAEVRVDAKGKVHVEELWLVIDAGLVVNPDRVIAQMEGAGIFGMSLALHGEITAKDGVIEQGNDAPPGGVGEPGVPPVAPAIVNAYFAATGKRVRELPLKKAGVV